MSYDSNGFEIERFQWVGKKVGFYGSIFIIALISVFPILWMLITSLKQPGNVVAFPVEYIPRNPTLENYRAAIEGAPFFRYMLNSAIVATGTAIVDVLLGALAGYALSRLRFRFKLPVLLLILGTAMLPFIARLIPLFSLARSWGLLNSYLGLIIPYAAFQLPFAVWIMQAYFNDLPDSLEEAAIMDGLTRVGVLFRIILPVSAPAMVTAAIIVFVYSWIEFLFALTFLQTEELYTISVGLQQFQGLRGTVVYNQLFAMSTLATLPLVIAFALFSEQFIKGMAGLNLK